MTRQTKLSLGSVLALVGGTLAVLGPLLGVGSLDWPWPFLIGFSVGVTAGLGAALAVAGLGEHRQG